MVTGAAWATALGTGLDEVWGHLLADRTGIRPVPSTHGLRNLLAAPVSCLDLDEEPARRQVALAGAVLRDALSHAKTPAATDPLLVLGTSYGAHLDDGSTVDLSAWAVEVAARAGVRRPPVSLSTACSSGSDAVLVGAQLIEAGVTDICVCGGVDILTPAKRLGHSALGTMSPTLLRAFDERADGTLLGEGAGFLVLESEARARQRGAPVLGVFSGGGSSNDAAGMTAPDPTGDGVLLAAERALAAAGLKPDDVAVINAHGSGTPANDAVEALSLARLFSTGHRPVVFATKGALGHSLGATGAMEAIAVILALRDRRVPPVHGLAQVAGALPLPVPAGGPRPIGTGVGMSLTLGFGGFNTCLIFEEAAADVG
ncbi:beta-ketoacyl synthase N-terminal-like domain-containing protein [Micromonospora matsumotoense]|uniref:beta-ketoacyl synthase N-terminal-like domain-containing protein n=1 Tax=Micromonospora matsumotoense TaxID=121616 RepID=UPI003441E296